MFNGVIFCSVLGLALQHIQTKIPLTHSYLEPEKGSLAKSDLHNVASDKGLQSLLTGFPSTIEASVAQGLSAGLRI